MAKTDIDLAGEIAEERTALAAILNGLSESQWDTPSLCEGWRVREVVAHMTMPYRYTPEQFMAEMAEVGGDFTKLSNLTAERDAKALSSAELAALLADNAHHPWEPPGGGLQGALSHDVLHGLDCTIPLGIDRKVPEQRLRPVLDGLATEGGHGFFGVDVTGIEFRADDLDWTFGSGTPLSGSAQDLAMVLCGRKLPPGRLRGEPGEKFTAG